MFSCRTGDGSAEKSVVGTRQFRGDHVPRIIPAKPDRFGRPQWQASSAARPWFRSKMITSSNQALTSHVAAPLRSQPGR